MECGKCQQAMHQELMLESLLRNVVAPKMGNFFARTQVMGGSCVMVQKLTEQHDALTVDVAGLHAAMATIGQSTPASPDDCAAIMEALSKTERRYVSAPAI